MTASQSTVYDLVGGASFFTELVDEFYRRVIADSRLRAMFPEDLEAGKRAQRLFLMQYFGGPTEYAAERGHPRLRMRHAPFAIGPAERDAWLTHMLAALEQSAPPEPALSLMQNYFRQAALAMQNRVE
jgi:hemoglobin